MTVDEQEAVIVTGVGPLHLSDADSMGIDSDAYRVLSDVSKKQIFSPKIPTIGAIDIATYAEKRGISVKVIDFFVEKSINYTSKIIGISSTFMSLHHVSEIVSSIRRNNPTSTIVLGGPLSWSMSPDEIFKLVPEINIIVLGEGEETFVQLVKSINCGENISKVAGLFIKQKDEVLFTGYREHLAGDAIPIPQWRLMNSSLAKSFQFLPVETGRGCPYNCAYCSEVNYWGKPPRYRSLDAVLNEIEQNINSGIKVFRFTDSCFSAPPQRAANLCDVIYQRFVNCGINVRWSSYARIENLSHSLLEKMQRSGCFALDIGVESGAPRILTRIGKHYSREQIIKVSKSARELGILTDFNIIVGFPGETDDTVNETIEMLQEAMPDAISCFVLFIAPNMGITQHSERYGIKGSWLSWSHATMKSDDAFRALHRISKNVTNSCSFPGAESFACNLMSLGYSVDEIRVFFKAVKRLISDRQDEATLTIVEDVCAKMRNLW